MNIVFKKNAKNRKIRVIKRWHEYIDFGVTRLCAFTANRFITSDCRRWNSIKTWKWWITR